MRYRILGRTGMKVSTLALGAGNFGTGWGYGSERSVAKEIFDAYRDEGGNFIDTADSYQFGQSEVIVGELIAADRDDIVLATKVSLGESPNAGLQRTGNSRKAMLQAVERSLRRLKTDRIDLLWVHSSDGVTPIEEIVRSLDDLSRAGKILYGGLSNFPAWRAATGATVAEVRGWAPIVALQFEYSLVQRSVERELLPMSAAFGLGAFGWSPLGGGLLTGKYRRGETGRLQGLGRVIHQESEHRKTITLDTVLAIADEIGTTPSQVAIAWVLSQGVLPIIGPRTLDQFTDNIRATDVKLSDDQFARLNAASAISLGFPHEGLIRNRNVLAGGKSELLDYPLAPVR